MVNGQLTEKEFIKTKFEDIVNVSNLFEGIVEYAVADKYISDTVTLYRFRNNKNIGTFEIDKDEMDKDLIDKQSLKTVNFVSSVSSIILYSLLLANMEIISTMNLELVLPLMLLHSYTALKALRYDITGFTSIEKAIEVNIIDAIGLIPIIVLLSMAAFSKHNYLMIAVYLLLALFISSRYLINVVKCIDNNDL